MVCGCPSSMTPPFGSSMPPPSSTCRTWTSAHPYTGCWVGGEYFRTPMCMYSTQEGTHTCAHTHTHTHTHTCTHTRTHTHTHTHTHTGIYTQQQQSRHYSEHAQRTTFWHLSWKLCNCVHSSICESLVCCVAISTALFLSLPH